jgi:hypothetical protein
LKGHILGPPALVLLVEPGQMPELTSATTGIKLKNIVS